jgi:hypothetical protein
MGGEAAGGVICIVLEAVNGVLYRLLQQELLSRKIL